MAQQSSAADAVILPPEVILVTPIILDFYRGRKYRPLDPAKEEIRLLRVHPDRLTANNLPSVFPQFPQWLKEGTDVAKLVKDNGAASQEPFICCQLLEPIKLGSMQSNYTALSYCAGSAHQTKRIMIDGYWFKAFANLEHALEGFRVNHDKNSWFGNIIWVDQACIRQDDFLEKSNQVALMRKIYSSAERTYVALSTPDAPIHELREGINALQRVLEAEASWSPDSSSPPLDIIAQLERPGSQDITSNNTALLILDLIYNKPGHPDADALPQFFKFMDSLVASKWWTRAWVLQEFIVSRAVYFICQSESIPLSDLESSLSFYTRYIMGFRSSDRHRPPLTLPSQTNPETTRITEALRRSIAQNNRIANQPGVASLFLSMREVQEELFRRPLEMLFLCCLINALSLGIKSTDPRDMHYAFCGLWHVTSGLKVDYRRENTDWDVWIKVTEYLLEGHKLSAGDEGLEEQSSGLGLAILTRAGETKGTGERALGLANLVPSWVPDWGSLDHWNLQRPTNPPGDEIQPWRFEQLGGAHTHALVQDPSRSKWEILCVDAQRLVIVPNPEPRPDDHLHSKGMRLTDRDILSLMGAVAPGDELWVIHGGIGIHVLRKRAEGGYLLVGIAVQVYGKFLDKAEAGGREDVMVIEGRYSCVHVNGVIKDVLKQGRKDLSELQRIEIF